MQLITESTNDVVVESVIEESTNIKQWFVEGVTLQSDIKNHNGRIYPFEVLNNSISTYVEKYLQCKRALGELDHPKENAASVNPSNVSHVFESVKVNGKDFVTKAKIIDTPSGKIVKSFLESGVKLGISSRGLGSIKESNGAKIVQEFQLVTLGDIVLDPSGPNCFLDAINESKEWIYQNGVLVEKDLSEEMDKYKKLIKEAKSKDIQDVVKNIFSDYIKKLKL